MFEYIIKINSQGSVSGYSNRPHIPTTPVLPVWEYSTCDSESFMNHSDWIAFIRHDPRCTFDDFQSDARLKIFDGDIFDDSRFIFTSVYGNFTIDHAQVVNINERFITLGDYMKLFVWGLVFIFWIIWFYQKVKNCCSRTRYRSLIPTPCSICLDDVETGQYIKKLECSHVFHFNCIDEWLKIKKTCPNCNYSIID